MLNSIQHLHKQSLTPLCGDKILNQVQNDGFETNSLLTTKNPLVKVYHLTNGRSVEMPRGERGSR